MKFNAIVDIDRITLKERSFAEAKLIYSKESTRKGRSLEKIVETCMYGHAAELYLMGQGFADDPAPFRDIIDPEGNPVEVKVTEGEYYVPYVLERANTAARDAWRKYPKHLYVFIGDKNTLDYHLHGIYLWNGEKFCLQSSESVV